MTEEHKETVSNEENHEVWGQVDEKSITSEISRHAKNPQNLGIIENPQSQATLAGLNEEFLSVQMYLGGVVIRDIRFQTNGNIFVVASASIATEFVKNKPLSHALTITADKIDSLLGGLPRAHKPAADLVADTVRAAAENAMENLSEPLKLMYLGSSVET